jgi:catechol 2,3-dioxygenase-like lactoylglutathione lyase family enzyme
MRGTIHHIDLTVSDLTVSAAFYETVLSFLGYRRMSTRPDYVDWNLPGSDGLLCSIGLKAARSDREHDRYSGGLHHLAWHAVDRGEVRQPARASGGAESDYPRSANRISSIWCRVLCRVLCRSGWPQA